MILAMGQKSSLSPTKRAKILTLREEGYTKRAISAQLKCSKNAVHNAIVKFKCDRIYTNRKRSGRLRKTTPRDDHTMRQVAMQSLVSSCKKIRAVLHSLKALM